MMLEEDLRRELAAAVEDVRPGPDPLVRLAALRRGRRRRRVWSAAVAATAAVALAFGGAAVVADRGDGPRTRADWLRRLREAPPRGALARDEAYVDTLARAAKGRVLLADDVPGHRIAVVESGGTLRYLVGPAGATAWTLAASASISNADADPFARRYVNDVYIGLAPPDCEVATAALPAATDWRPVGSYVARVAPLSPEWWRVTCDGTVRFEGPARGFGLFGPFGPPVTQADVAAIDQQSGQTYLVLAPLDSYRSFAERVGDKAIGLPKLLFPYIGHYAALAAPAVGGGWWLQLSTGDDGYLVIHVRADPAGPAAVSAVVGSEGRVHVVGSEPARTARIRVGARTVAEGPIIYGGDQLMVDRAADLTGAVVETFDLEGRRIGSAPLEDGPPPRDVIDRWDG